MLKDQLFIGGVWTDDAVIANNVGGTPLISANWDGSGEAISDTYTLTISARVGSTGTVTISASANNPYNGRVKTGVTFDDVTEYTNIVPGVTLIFDNAGANGNTATVKVGNPYGSFDASGVGAGVPTTGVRHRVLNNGSSAVSEAQVKLMTQAVQVAITNRVFSSTSPFAENATEKTAGGGSNRVMPYAITITGVAGSGPTRTCTLNVDGSPFGANTLLDLTTGTTQNGNLVKALGDSYPYRVVDGPLEGLEFAIDTGIVNADKANILIFPSRFIQIAEDISGVEGTYGVTPVNLTEAGQSTGVITATTGVAFYWTRFLVPSSANNESNPYPTLVAISAAVSSDAGWDA